MPDLCYRPITGQTRSPLPESDAYKSSRTIRVTDSNLVRSVTQTVTPTS